MTPALPLPLGDAPAACLWSLDQRLLARELVLGLPLLPTPSHYVLGDHRRIRAVRSKLSFPGDYSIFSTFGRYLVTFGLYLVIFGRYLVTFGRYLVTFGLYLVTFRSFSLAGDGLPHFGLRSERGALYLRL